MKQNQKDKLGNAFSKFFEDNGVKIIDCEISNKKEQLVVEIAKLRGSHAGWVEGDERRRKEFAKAFNWWKKTAYNYDGNDPLCPTWEQIFVEVGKLLASRNFMNLEGNISELKCRLEDLEKNIKKEINPNFNH